MARYKLPQQQTCDTCRKTRDKYEWFGHKGENTCKLCRRKVVNMERHRQAAIARGHKAAMNLDGHRGGGSWEGRRETDEERHERMLGVWGTAYFEAGEEFDDEPW